MSPLAIIVIAFVLDVMVGDPYAWPHPVKAMGAYIDRYQAVLRRPHHSKTQQLVLGLGLALSLLALTWGLTYASIRGLESIHPLLADAWRIYLVYTTFSIKMLGLEAKKVYQTLTAGTLDQARQQVSHIVGRQTDQLTADEVAAAAIETVAENTSDGFIAPLFYTVLFGVYGGLVYKAINTLDSMVAYKTANYLYFGRFSARLDDLANWLPARLTWVLMVTASLFPPYDFAQACRIGWRDAQAHASPNAGLAEAVMAGALNIQLGGPSTYHGQRMDKPTLGDPVKAIQAFDIVKAIRLLYRTALLAIILLIFVLTVVF